MVTEGIVLGHIISCQGIQVDKAKVEVIENLPPPTTVKGIRSFLGHAGFYRRFIKDFSKISKPLCMLLQQNQSFVFNEECFNAFIDLKKKLSSAPIIVPPKWDASFELMCVANDYAVGEMLGKIKVDYVSKWVEVMVTPRNDSKTCPSSYTKIYVNDSEHPERLSAMRSLTLITN
ncbi:uncharacterized mitochondrial protein AtMg00860-like [Hibiscus syriacus]|uniref:uncharacterized mitochondrial protein AtMg00860-like n=1 Tax=Hibiscus syriacus TaxID=106335 RepID=UPI001921FE52|nr:uncharacterized mitochondrial protein AtMg00860-like [Hibiscus syriacus]